MKGLKASSASDFKVKFGQLCDDVMGARADLSVIVYFCTSSFFPNSTSNMFSMPKLVDPYTLLTGIMGGSPPETSAYAGGRRKHPAERPA